MSGCSECEISFLFLFFLWHCGKTDGERILHTHPYPIHVHILIPIQTDDVGFFCSPVSNEYLLAASHFALSRKDILRICRKGIEAIFGGSTEKNRLWGLLDGFEGVELVGLLLSFMALWLYIYGVGVLTMFRKVIRSVVFLMKVTGVWL